MATSGNVTFNNTCNEIIYAALRKCGMLAEGETPTAQMVTDARGDLNRIVKGWGAIGLKIWTKQEIVLFLDTTSQSYTLGASGDECTVAEDLVETTLSASAAANASTVVLTSASGFTNADRVGILLDDNTLHWTTATKSGSTLTLASNLAGAAAAGNVVYSYTNKSPRPNRIVSARVRNSSGIDTPLRKLSNDEYFALSDKASEGQPNSFYYQPRTADGLLYLWPVTPTAASHIRATAERQIEDFSAASNNPDLPPEWLQPLLWNLAREVMIEYGVDADTKADIRAAADYWKGVAMDFDVDDTSITFQPDFS